MLKILVVVLTFQLVTSCSGQDESFDSPSIAGAPQSAEIANMTSYELFDPSYDYNPSDRFTAESIAARFPIHAAQTSQIAVLRPGGEFYAARMQLLEQAQRSVRIQSLLFTADESGYELAEKLIELNKRGVKVKIIVDPVNNITLSEQVLYFKMRRAGVQIEGYEFMYLNFIASYLQRTSIGAAITELNYRYHEKYFIVDAEDPVNGKAIVGGSNLANDYFRVEHETPNRMWTDCDVLVQGAVVADLLRTFEDNLVEFIKRKTTIGLEPLGVAWDFFAEKYEALSSKRPSKLRTPIIDRLKAYTQRPLELTWLNAKVRLIQSRPRFQEDLIHTAYIHLIDKSERSVDIANAYFIPDSDLLAAIKRAVQRGVHVRILTNSENSLDFIKTSAVLISAARATYTEVLEANKMATGLGKVEIFEWGGHKTLNNREGQLHAKFAVFDKSASIVGSYNFDPRGRNLNSENILAMESSDVALRLVEDFELYLTPAISTQITDAQALGFAQPTSKRDSYLRRISSIVTPYL